MLFSSIFFFFHNDESFPKRFKFVDSHLHFVVFKALNLDCSKILSFDKEVMDFFPFVLLVPEDHLNT